MDYPHIPLHIPQEELVEFFTLAQEERYILPEKKDDKNMLGFAVLLKTFQFLGYPPRRKEDIPNFVVSWIAKQIDLEASLFSKYLWKEKLWDIHLSAIRNFTGFRPFSESDSKEITEWLIHPGKSYSSRQKMYFAVFERFRDQKIELPMEKELQRLVNSTWQKWFESTCNNIANKLSQETIKNMEQCLNVPSSQDGSYEWLKSPPGKFGMKGIKREIKKRLFIDALGLNISDHFKSVPPNIIKTLRDRAYPEVAYQMKRHPEHIRYALLAALLYYRRMEVTDNIVNIFLHLIRVIDKKLIIRWNNSLSKTFRRSMGSERSFTRWQRLLFKSQQVVFKTYCFQLLARIFCKN